MKENPEVTKAIAAYLLLEKAKELIGKAERSEVLQGCPPSANCSAGAGADARNDSLISSPVPREKAELSASEIWVCSHTRKCGWVGRSGELKYVPSKDWPRCSVGVCPKCGDSSFYIRQPKALPPQGERALARNAELCDREQ
jgi:hypothetical protein